MVIKDVKTELWNNIISSHVKTGRKGGHEYDGFDKGIDNEFDALRMYGEQMFFAWDNWFEGEIKCSDGRQAEMEQRFTVKFKTGEPLYLKPEILEKELGNRLMK